LAWILWTRTSADDTDTNLFPRLSAFVRVQIEQYKHQGETIWSIRSSWIVAASVMI
jgi:hypothetical protein